MSHEHNALQMNEPILLQIGISGPRGKDMKLQQWGQEVKGQGHSRPELDLEAWWGIILDPLSSAKAEVMRPGPFFCHLFCLPFDEIWHTTADLEQNHSHVTKIKKN